MDSVLIRRCTGPSVRQDFAGSGSLVTGAGRRRECRSSVSVEAKLRTHDDDRRRTLASHAKSARPRRAATVRRVNLRDEIREDWAAVSGVHREAFGDHGEVVAALVDDLRPLVRQENGLSLVAEQAGRIIGHVMLTRSLLDAPDQLLEVQVLSPVGVLPGHQRQGVGAEMIHHALQIMTKRQVPVVFLEGSPAYYSRFGFGAAARMGFRKPSLRIPDAAFQALRLPAYEDWMVGTLVYADAFWRHDAVGLRPHSA